MPAQELRKLTQRGGIEHIAHGLYRFEDFPYTGREQFLEAVLRVGEDAHLVGDAVLALNNLALVNPRKIRVGVRRRPRRQLPEFIEVVRDTAPETERQYFDGIPGTTITQALLDCRGTVMRDRLVEAARDAAQRGLLPLKELDGVVLAIENGK